MKKRKQQIRTLYDLAFKSGTAVKLVNLVTIYRIITFPLLVYFILSNEFDLFKWFLGISFLTDAVDGMLARKFNAYSILGAKLDSIGDDLTVAAGAFGLAYFEWDFFSSQIPVLIIVFALFLIQTLYAIKKYGRQTNFHTYGAKLAAILQGCFLLSVFFFDSIQYWLYYTAIIITFLQLVEETIMINLMPKWKNDVKGIYWAMKNRK